ncbi:hypothetical protein [Parasphingorhabdus sp.]|uniref:hypothetical protein n=1 Tax=Parasphingorhabdus sp. TaxID=2709688 RepID=UPI003A92FE31
MTYAYAIMFVFYIAATLTATAGWFMNVLKLFNLPWDTFTGEMLIRLVGIPVPFIGAIAGWF